MMRIDISPEAYNDLDGIKIIRVLDNRRDFMYVLFGIPMLSDENDDFWGDE